jgi:phosphatidylglycerophosphatase A
MSSNNSNSIKEIPWYHWHHVLISTTIVGFIPGARGTYGAFIALLLWIYLYVTLLPSTLFFTSVALVVATLLIGVRSSNVMERYWGRDSRTVVIDEYLGTWIAVLAALFHNGTSYIVITLATFAFVLFRVIDITKPLGCRWIDENIHGGWGCMLDDMLAGFYACCFTILAREIHLVELFYKTTIGKIIIDIIDA